MYGKKLRNILLLSFFSFSGFISVRSNGATREEDIQFYKRITKVYDKIIIANSNVVSTITYIAICHPIAYTDDL